MGADKKGKKRKREKKKRVWRPPGKLKEITLRVWPRWYLHKQMAARSRRPNSGGKQVGKSGCST